MKNKPVILCVDDEDIILSSLKNELGTAFGKEYDLYFAESGNEALQLVEEIIENEGELPLVITDYIMPIIRGDELLAKIHSILPQTKSIMLTGHASTEGIANAVNNARLYRFISKPWNPDDLVMTIDEAIKSFYSEKTIREQNQKLLAMNIKLDEMNKHLDEMNRNLEQLVTQRTKDLQDARDKLIQANNLLIMEKENLRVASITDSLTGLYNRGHILKRLEDEILRYLRYDTVFSVLMIDIDNFKGVNDRFGHIVGDEVLKKTAEVLRRCLRETDLLGRYGGEEFFAILVETDLNNAAMVAERMRKEMENTDFGFDNARVTISGGVCEYRDSTLDLILNCADSLMYEAKRNGKNRIEVQCHTCGS